MYNHWIAKIRFKERIETNLYPILKQYINCVFTTSLADNIEDTVNNWIDNQNDTVFDCRILIEFKQGNVVKKIMVIPVD